MTQSNRLSREISWPSMKHVASRCRTTYTSVKKRERAKEDMEQQLKKMEEESSKRAAGITSKFTANYDAVEEHLKTKTVGEETVVRGESSKAHKSDGSGSNSTADGKVAQKRVLSFAFEDEEEEEEAPVITKKRLGMDPTIDTSFLPDKDREAEIERKKIELAAIWKAQQEREKNEEITVAFAYWDGSSHRKNLKVKKGHTISQFLTWAIEVGWNSSKGLRTVSNYQFERCDFYC
ncbi:XAP5 protein [Ostertagia ostertagi]